MRTLVAIALAGCFTTPPRPDKQPNVDGCMLRAHVQCVQRDMCSGNFRNLHDFGDEATCEARIAVPCLNASQILDSGNTPDENAICVTELEADSCEDFFDNHPPNDCAPEGPGDVGTPCGVQSQCKDGFCQIAEDAICGTCQPAPGPGAPCVVEGDCGKDLACAIPTGETTGTCALWVHVGGACKTNVAPCELELSCVGDTGTAMGTCMPSVTTIGASCDGSRAIIPTCDGQIGLVCIALVSNTFTCQLIQFAAPGETCGNISSPRSFVDCSGGGICVKASSTDKTGTCVGPAADGDACSNDPSIGPPCLQPAKCVDGVCTMADPRMCN